MSQTELQQHLDTSSAPWLRAQLFFERLASEVLLPSYGHLQRDWVSALLVRAREADLYRPDAQVSQ